MHETDDLYRFVVAVGGKFCRRTLLTCPHLGSALGGNRELPWLTPPELAKPLIGQPEDSNFFMKKGRISSNM